MEHCTTKPAPRTSAEPLVDAINFLVDPDPRSLVNNALCLRANSPMPVNPWESSVSSGGTFAVYDVPGVTYLIATAPDDNRILGGARMCRTDCPHAASSGNQLYSYATRDIARGLINNPFAEPLLPPETLPQTASVWEVSGLFNVENDVTRPLLDQAVSYAKFQGASACILPISEPMQHVAEEAGFKAMSGPLMQRTIRPVRSQLAQRNQRFVAHGWPVFIHRSASNEVTGLDYRFDNGDLAQLEASQLELLHAAP